MEERIYNITQNCHVLNSLFFNHDRNPAHHSAVHTALVLLSLASEKGFHDDVCNKQEQDENMWLEKKLEIIGDDILKREGLIIAPGVLLQSLADNHIPPNMIIAKVETRFAYPLLVPVDKGSKELKVAVLEERHDNLPGVIYSFNFYCNDLYGKQVQPIKSMKITAFYDSISTDQIFQYIKKDFEDLKDSKKDQIHNISHNTFISADDDESYWRSIQNKNPFKRNGSISQLELLAKVPRILSMEVDKLENSPPKEYYGKERDLKQFFSYAEKEKSYGINNGKSIEERAMELSMKMRYIYARQTTVFDPRIRLDLNYHFSLKTGLLGRIKKGVHTFISEALLEESLLFIDESKIIISPLLTDRVIAYLNKINYSVNELERFRYK